jgi:hypothetical protein
VYRRNSWFGYVIVNTVHTGDNKDDDDDNNNNNNNNNNITCNTNCKYRTAATLYTAETWFVSGI